LHALPVGTDEVQLGNLTVNFAAYAVSLDGTAVELARHEFELLRVLCLQSGRIVKFDDLCSALWGSIGPKERRRLNVMVFRLRAKLAASSPYRLEMVRGRGYGLIAPRALGGASRESEGRSS
jgi:DNA-binding response OmpR family regulator